MSLVGEQKENPMFPTKSEGCLGWLLGEECVRKEMQVARTKKI